MKKSRLASRSLRRVRPRRPWAGGVRTPREGGHRQPDRVRCEGERGHLGGRLRRDGRPGQGREGRGSAQRHRAAAGLGQLRRDHQGVRGQVRHQGQLRPARRRQPGRDQRGQTAGQGTDRAPDVFDLGQAVALANTGLFAPYKVSTFDDIPTQFKDPNGTWVNDYGGYMSIGYDSAKVPDDDRGRRPAAAPSSRARSPSTVTRRPPAPRLQRRADGRDRQRRLGRRHRSRRRLLRTS